MIIENSDSGGYKFAISYHFESNVRAAGERSHPTRVKRLAQEAVTLSTALPLSYSSSVFVRCDADRLDIMKVYYIFSCNVLFKPITALVPLITTCLFLSLKYNQRR